MNFLYIQAKNATYDFPWALTEAKHTVTFVDAYAFDPLEENPLALAEATKAMQESSFDYVVSCLFIPEISDLCERMSIDYISWTYDSPLVSLFHPSVYNSHNYIFIFDRAQYEHLSGRGIPHIYHLPLAANTSRVGALQITPEDEAAYSSDISFIGRLYEDNSYNTIIHFFPEHLALELKTYLMKHLCNWHTTKPWPETSSAVTQFIQDNLLQNGPWNRWGMEDSLYYGILILSRKLAEMDRVTVLNTLAQQFAVDVYTGSSPDHLVGVQLHHGVEYHTQSNKVFYLSKINLNITLPSIETGLPQRIFDIMGSGGFVLTNYQAELEEIFTIGEDLEVFHDLQELLDKTAYYLTHEKERLTIAMNGYQKVRDHHTYLHRIDDMIRTVEEEKH